MDEKTIIESLSPIERSVLPSVSREPLDLKEIAEKSGVDETTARRAVGFLVNKELVLTNSSSTKFVILGILGINYLKKELPERVLLNKLTEKSSIPIGEIKNVCALNENEAKIAFGTLKKKAVVEINQGRVSLVPGNTDVSKKMLEELFMEKLPLEIDSLELQDLLAFQNLKSRKDIIEVEEKTLMEVKLTSLGEKISKMKLGGELLESLTPKILKQNSWKGKRFRRYDLTSNVPRIHGGKKHFVNQATDYGRSVWLEMGFKEMSGNYVDTGFWVFDTLFTAQDHPVRDMQDTFFLKGLKGELPEKIGDKNGVVYKTKQAHEGGLDSSYGWQYEWNEEDAKKVLLRTHTTCLSSRKLRDIAKSGEFPAKYFSVGKCFRNETVDWSHGFEFNQTEGIVVDENANFRQLLGYLTQFFKKMGYPKIRIRPAYFAYTEPSLEMDFWNEERGKWVELGAAGMFRPEVTIPMFGRHIPVLAWGPGFDRMITQFYGIKDLRELYKNDINKLREMKAWRH